MDSGWTKSSLRRLLWRIFCIIIAQIRGVSVKNFIMWPVASRVFGQFQNFIITLPNGLKLYANMGDQLGRLLTFTGARETFFWEPSSVRLAQKCASTAKVALVAGSHIGYFGLMVAWANEKITVFMFEPVRYLFLAASQNINLNNLASRVQLANTGLGDKNHQAKIIVDSLRSKISEETFATDKTFETVDIITADAFFDQHQIAGVDLLVLDVEGHEPKVFEGMKKTLSNHPPRDIIVEVMATEFENKKLPEHIKLLESMGYCLYYIHDDYDLGGRWIEDIILVPIEFIDTVAIGRYFNVYATRRAPEEMETMGVTIKKILK